MQRILLCAVGVLLLGACEGALTPPVVDAGTGGGGGGSSSSGCDGVTPRPRPDFFDALLGQSSPAGCASSGCHGGNAGQLTFTTATQFAAATVGVRASTDPSRFLIAPGSPEQSVLYRRLLADAPSRMPQGGPYLSDAQLAEVAGWICAGALAPLADGGTGGGGGGTGGGGGGTDAGAGLTLTTITPSQLTVGTAGAVTLSGTGFTSASVAQLDAELLATTFVSAQQLTANVSVTSTASARGASLKVNNGTASTALLPFTIANPAPTLTALTPAQVPTNSAAVTLTLTGTGFNGASTVSFDGAPATATLISATSLTLLVPTLTSARGYPVTVTNPAPGGGTSASLMLQAVALTGPVITGLAPNPTLEGQAFSLTVSGGGFSCSGQGSVVTLNGMTLTPGTCSTTQLVVAAPALAAGSDPVTVRNGTGTPSAPASLSVIAPNPVPTLTSLNPTSAVGGLSGFTLTLTGTGFGAGASARWNGAARATTVVSATQATASISSADVASAGTALVTLFNPAPGGGTSNALSFGITQSNPVPTVATLSPCGAVAGGAGFTLSLSGTNFRAGSTVTLGATALTVTGQTATSLTVTVPPAALATAPASNTLALVVTNPAPGGGASTAATFGLASAAASLSANVQPFFTSTCATMGCHTASSPTVPMSLAAGQSYASLVGVPCSECVPRLRVKACDPSTTQSYLIAKVKNLDVCSGTRMPKAAPLTAAELQLLVNWVAQGAPP